MHDLQSETLRFRNWAAGLAAHDGQWECVYEGWSAWYEAVLAWFAASPQGAPSAEDAGRVVYAIARDNDARHLVGEIRKRHPEALLWLTRIALLHGEADARWQLAVELGQLTRNDEVETLRLALADDEHEYVRRRAIRSLAALGVPAAEALAWAAWHRVDEHQQWARMSALDCLQDLNSPHLAALLDDAIGDERPHLRRYAQQLRDRRDEALRGA